MARSRSGFTLIEVLVVVTLVALLTAILVPASMAVIGTSRDAATKAQLRIAGSVLSSRVAAQEISNARVPLYELVILMRTMTNQAAGLPAGDKARVEAVRDAISARVTGIAGSDKEAQKALVKKEYFRLQFPQTWEEAEYQLAINGMPSISTNQNSQTESAEVLYFVLTSGKVIGSVPLDAQVISPSLVKDTDGNGRKEIVDAWGKPVRFYRWPTRLLRPSGLAANYRPRQDAMNTVTVNVPTVDANDQKLAAEMFSVKSGSESTDPLDPIGFGISASIPDSAIVANDTSSQVAAYEQAYNLPATYHEMFIVSAGPDGEFGLENPCNATSFGKWCKPSNAAHVHDNVSSRTVNTN